MSSIPGQAARARGGSWKRGFVGHRSLFWLIVSATGTTGSAHAAPPKTKSCVDVAIDEVNPAKVEWSYWIAGGAVFGDEKSNTRPSLGLGMELTVHLFEYQGFPAARGSNLFSRAEVRIGPWVSAAERFDTGSVIEGGTKMHFGAIAAPSWGTFDARLGLGYGAFETGRSPHVVMTVLWGVRGVPARFTRRGYCDPPAIPRAVAEASVLRLFVTHRRTLDGERGAETVVGIELSPSYVLPPYSGARLWGGAAR